MQVTKGLKGEAKETTESCNQFFINVLLFVNTTQLLFAQTTKAEVDWLGENSCFHSMFTHYSKENALEKNFYLHSGVQYTKS